LAGLLRTGFGGPLGAAFPRAFLKEKGAGEIFSAWARGRGCVDLALPGTLCGKKRENLFFGHGWLDYGPHDFPPTGCLLGTGFGKGSFADLGRQGLFSGKSNFFQPRFLENLRTKRVCFDFSGGIPPAPGGRAAKPTGRPRVRPLQGPGGGDPIPFARGYAIFFSISTAALSATGVCMVCFGGDYCAEFSEILETPNRRGAAAAPPLFFQGLEFCSASSRISVFVCLARTQGSPGWARGRLAFQPGVRHRFFFAEKTRGAASPRPPSAGIIRGRFQAKGESAIFLPLGGSFRKTDGNYRFCGWPGRSFCPQTAFAER